MWWFLAALAVVVHVYFWGAGLAMLVLPRRFERLWPALAPVCGLALQAAVVYWAGKLPLPGANSYARPVLLLPALLGVAAWCWRRRGGRSFCYRALGRWWPLALAQVGVFALLLGIPASHGLKLTSFALGSCDAGDYAAGVRVFQEFAPGDQGGVLAQAETVAVGSTDDFRTFWLQLNHFGPVAAMALNAAVWNLPLHEIVSLFTLILPGLFVPLVFVAARMLFRFPAAGSWVLAVAVGSSPLLAYAAYQVAPAQLMATGGVLGATLASVQAFEAARGWRGCWRWTGVFVVSVTLVMASYNFILVAAFAPAVGWVGWRLIERREFGRAARWAAWMTACLCLVAVLLPHRTAGLWERLVLLEEHAFGWPIPGLRPEAWLGAVAAPGLEPAGGGLYLAGLVLLAGFVLALAGRPRWRRRAFGVLVAFAGPALAGYAILMGRAAAGDPMSSYSAFKLLTVFLPFVVAGFCPWLACRRQEAAPARAFAGGLAGLLLLVNGTATLRFHAHLNPPPLVVDSGLRKLARLEQLPGVESVNLRIAHFWSRIWANAYLLRLPHYFEQPTYEGRRDSPLRARFDLRDALVRVVGPAGEGPVFAAPGFELVDRTDRWFVEPRFGRGWFGVERRDVVNWRWSGERPVLVLRRPAGSPPLRTRVVLDLRSTGPRGLVLRCRGAETWRGAISAQRDRYAAGELELLSGDNEIEFDSPEALADGETGEARRLFIALFEFRLEVIDPPPHEPS